MRKEDQTICLKDLEGKPGITTAYWVRSRTEAMRVVAAGKTATSADNNGALNIWRDRQGVLHAEFFRQMLMLDHSKRLTLGDLRTWLRKWWPELKHEKEEL